MAERLLLRGTLCSQGVESSIHRVGTQYWEEAPSHTPTRLHVGESLYVSLYCYIAVMTLTQVANMYLTFAIVLNSEFGSTSITSYCLNAIYLTITGIQVFYFDPSPCSSYTLWETILAITRKCTDCPISCTARFSCSPCSVRRERTSRL